ncbi:hypothetical protein PIIN_10215 [Serendipita indica DSM 11827]|uniref:Uncharacterized protein n=1 Tax=Serendipita indica (strain DSM 11827) TaxID=1109443 RepID=G4TY29_SERID|nr:hypothetical protein PIIN_10215 [Serendipita indica DSM 11827]
MKIYKLFQRAVIIRYRLPYLPTEIWCYILELAVDIPEALGTTCTPERILEYLLHHHFQQYPHSGTRFHMYTKPPSGKYERCAVDPGHPYEVHMRRKATLSLVCSEWNTIIRRHSIPWALGDTDEASLGTAERIELISYYTPNTTVESNRPSGMDTVEADQPRRDMARGGSAFFPLSQITDLKSFEVCVVSRT